MTVETDPQAVRAMLRLLPSRQLMLVDAEVVIYREDNTLDPDATPLWVLESPGDDVLVYHEKLTYYRKLAWIQNTWVLPLDVKVFAAYWIHPSLWDRCGLCIETDQGFWVGPKENTP